MDGPKRETKFKIMCELELCTQKYNKRFALYKCTKIQTKKQKSHIEKQKATLMRDSILLLAFCKCPLKTVSE